MNNVASTERRILMPQFEIYYHDLTENAKKDLLLEFGYKDEKQFLLATNADIIPIAVYEIFEDEVHPNQISMEDI